MLSGGETAQVRQCVNLPDDWKQTFFDEFDRRVRDALRSALRGAEPSPCARDALLRAASERAWPAHDRPWCGGHPITRSAQENVIAYLVDIYLQRPSISV